MVHTGLAKIPRKTLLFIVHCSPTFLSISASTGHATGLFHLGPGQPVPRMETMLVESQSLPPKSAVAAPLGQEAEPGKYLSSHLMDMCYALAKNTTKRFRYASASYGQTPKTGL